MHGACLIKENAKSNIAQVTAKAGFITAYFSRPGNYCLLSSHAPERATDGFTLDAGPELLPLNPACVFSPPGVRFDPRCLQHLGTFDRRRNESASL